MTDIEQEARAEAGRRWHDPRYNHDAQAMFVQGAVWAASHPASPAIAQIVSSGRQSGKTAAMIDALLDRANARGIRVEIAEPAAAARVSPKIAEHLDRLARDVAYTEGHASVMRAAADVIRQAASPATRETVTEEMVERAARAAYDRAFLKHAPEDVDRWDDLVADNDAAAESWRRVARSALEAALTEGKAD